MAAGASMDIPTRMLVLGMVRSDGTIDAGELYAVANACGMTDQQVRLCLLRLVADGLFERHGRGRRATFRATPSGLETITPDVEFVRFAYLQDAGAGAWDGRWRLVGFAVPEDRRGARDAFRDRLIHLGGAPIQSGLYASPNDWHPLVEREAAAMELAADVNLVVADGLRVGGEEDPRRIAGILWPLDEVAAGWRRLLRDLRRHERRIARLAARDEHDTYAERLRMAFEIALAFNRAIDPDPLLPPELLPQPWPGTTARAVQASLWPSVAGRWDDPAHPAVFRVFRDLATAPPHQRTRAG